MSKVLLIPMPQQAKVRFESLQPGTQSGLNTPEVLVVSFLPETPGPNHKDLHEHRFIPQPLTFMDDLNSVSKQGPLHTQQIPTLPAKGAGKKQVLNRLLRRLCAEEAAIVIMLQSHPSSPEHVAGVESVSKQKPAKNFPLIGAARFPNPFECNIRFFITKAVQVVVARSEPTPSPNSVPGIPRARGHDNIRSSHLHISQLMHGLGRKREVKTGPNRPSRQETLH